MSKLITASLVSAIDWLTSCPSSWKAKAKEDLTNQLSRIWIEPPADSPLRLGQDFEKKVYQQADNKLIIKVGSENFQWFVEQCRGGVFQKKCRKIIEVDSEEYCLYGKIDVWFPGVLKDIKTTSNYKGREAYEKSFQHVLYMYVEHIERFEYLIAEFQKGSKQIAEKHHIIIEVPDTEPLREIIDNTIRKVMGSIESSGLMELYKTKFCLY